MSTKLDYQVFGNTLRVVNVKDIVLDKGVYDATTSPNNGVVHGNICFNYATTQISTPPTTNTGNAGVFAFYGQSKSASTTSLTISLSNSMLGNDTTLTYSVDNFGSVIIDGVTFYGAKSANLRCSVISSSSACGICTAPLKITVMKANATSQEITTEVYNIESKSGYASSPTSGRSTGGNINLSIAKTADDILLFVGIENILE